MKIDKMGKPPSLTPSTQIAPKSDKVSIPAYRPTFEQEAISLSRLSDAHSYDSDQDLGQKVM